MTPKSSSARASTKNSSTGVALLSRPGLAIATVGAMSVSTSITYCGEAVIIVAVGTLQADAVEAVLVGDERRR